MNYPQRNSGHPDSLALGQAFEDFVVLTFSFEVPLFNLSVFRSQSAQWGIGETAQGVEIKYDSNCTQTGRLSIETAARRDGERGRLGPEGIFAKPRSIIYIQGDTQRIFAFGTNVLRKLSTRRDRYPRRYHPPELPTIETFYLSLRLAEQIALFVVDAGNARRWLLRRGMRPLGGLGEVLGNPLQLELFRRDMESLRTNGKRSLT